MPPENVQPRTIQDVEQIAAKVGVSITPDDYNQAYIRAEQSRQHLEEQQASQTPKTGVAALVEQFNRLYPKFLQTLLGAGDVLLTLTQTVLIAFGVPLVLLMLLVVEQQRVQHGLELFEIHDGLAILGALAFVLANLLFELGISWIEHRAKYEEPPQYEFSFRILAQRIGYWFGRSTTWEPRKKSPANRWKKVLWAISIAILILALGGSMTEVIRQTSGDWIVALQNIALKSTLLQLVTWISGFIFAFTAVVTAQALSRYVAERVVEIVAIMNSTAPDKSQAIAEAAGFTAAMYLYSRVKDAQKVRRTAATASAADMPDMGIGGSIHIPTVFGSERTPNERSEQQTYTPNTERTPRTLSPAKDKCKAFLQDHPTNDGAKWTVRTLAKATGVGQTTAGDVLNGK